MWCAYDKPRANDILRRMSPMDRVEAGRLADRLNAMIVQEMAAKHQVIAAVKKYGGRPAKDVVQDWSDLALIAAVIVLREPKLRKFVIDKGKEQVEEKVRDAGVTMAIGDKDISEPINKVLGVLFAGGPWTAAYAAYDPFQSLGDDSKPDLLAARERLTKLEQEFTTTLILLTMIFDRYDSAYLCDAARIMGPQMTVAPKR